MGLSQIITGISVFLTALVPAGCHKAPPPPPKASPAVIIVSPTSTPQHDLGEVALTNHLERCLQLGGGKDCTLTPHVVDSRTTEITVSLESKNAAGKVQGVSVMQVTAKSGAPLALVVGDYKLSLTPDVTE
jgi:hypothetical protein